jgi:CheY-like chemotaxis protein
VANITIIDDDLSMDVLSDNLRYRCHEAYRIPTATEALNQIEKIISSDLVILDIIMSWPSNLTPIGLSGVHTAGLEIFREIRKHKPEIPIIVYSGMQDAGIINNVLKDDSFTWYISKWGSPSLKDFIGKINQILGINEKPSSHQAFIVHGHNDVMKLELKNYLQNTLHFLEPIILHEKPNLGRTIIEKFEDYCVTSTFVFVLLTPDDLVIDPDKPDDEKRRARQNIIFEMGYFLGNLGRTSGKVLLLYNPPIELPSDLSGVIYIDISNGIESVGEKIRREVENVDK